MDVASGREDAGLELLMRLQPLIISSIKKYYNKTEDMEDLVQEGRLLVLQSIGDYREDYSVPYLGFIKSRLKYLYLGKNRNRRILSLNVQVGEDGEDHMDLLEDGFKLEEDYIRREQGSELLRMISRLPLRERQVVQGYYLENLSIGDISKRHGITYRTVVNTKRRALERMRKEMEEEHV